MKIVQLVTRNCVGGVQVVAQALHAGFRAQGHDAALWFFADTEEGTPRPPHSRSIVGSRAERLYYARLLRRLLALLWHERPDAVIAHTTNTAIPGLALAGLVGVRKRVVVQHNPLDTYSVVARRADRLFAEIGVYWRNVTVAKAVSVTMGGYAPRAMGRVRMIHNGMKVPVRRGAPSAEERMEMRRGLGLPLDGRPLVVTVGRLAEQKNQGALVEAMRSLEGMVLAIAGDGPLRAELEARIAAAAVGERVRMLGSLRPAEVRMLLRSGDMFVTPSHFEAMPMVVLEAMQEGAAIIASDIEAHRELLGGDALLVPPNAAGVSAAIRRLAGDPELRERLSRGALKRAKQFSEASMVEGYLRLLEEL